MTPLFVVVAVLGLAVGSFLNVVIHRVPRGESLVRPGLALPALPDRDPRRGTTYRCSAGWCCAGAAPAAANRSAPAIPWSRPAPRPSSSRSPPGSAFSAALPAYLYLAAITVALALIDVDVKRLPNAIVLPSYLVGSACSWSGPARWTATGRPSPAGCSAWPRSSPSTSDCPSCTAVAWASAT